jgi:hypothetical protein
LGIDEDLVFGVTVVLIDPNGGIDIEVPLDPSVDPGEIGFVDGAPLEGPFELCLGPFVTTGHHQPGGLLIDPVDGIGIRPGVVADLIEEGVGGLRFVGVDEDPAGFVEDQEITCHQNRLKASTLGLEKHHFDLSRYFGGLVSCGFAVYDEPAAVYQALCLSLGHPKLAHDKDKPMHALRYEKFFFDKWH